MYDIYYKNIEKILKENRNLFEFSKPNTLNLINGDFLQENWKDANLMLANSTCFSEELIRKIAIKANNECKKGTIIVTFSKRLTNLNSDWESKRGFRRLMTWGIATVYLHRRKN